jgi:class 3 adenylate cyclase
LGDGAQLIRDRYEILDTVSQRDDGRAVHKAFDHRLGITVALKVLVVDDVNARDDLIAETKTLQLLEPHGGLPRLRNDFDLDDGSYVVVIDWVDGEDLETKLEADGRPGLVHSSVVDWVAQVAAALDHLHGQDPPIVHGDVKPSNIVLTRTNRVVLLDFGIARIAGQTSRAGTRGYMAPEVGASEPVTPATDVYGLAATTFALLTGNPPSSSRPDWIGVDKSAIAVLEQVLERALATDPTRRYQSAGEFAKRLAAGSTALHVGNVTLLALEIADAQRFWDSDAQSMPDVLGRVGELVRITIDEANGMVSGGEGGGERVLAGFASVSAALRAALTIRNRVDEDSWMRKHDVRLRMALHNGEPEQRGGQYWGRSVQQVQRLRDCAAPSQILVSWTSAPLLMDRLPAGIRLAEVALPDGAVSTTTIGTVYSAENGEVQAVEPRPAPPGPVVAPPPMAPPPRRHRSDEQQRLVRERNQIDDAIRRKLLQEDEAQRAGQSGMAARFKHEAEALAIRFQEIQREIERVEAAEGGHATG